MRTSKYELEDNIKSLIQDLRILKVFNQEEYYQTLNAIKEDLGEQYFNTYFKELMEK